MQVEYLRKKLLEERDDRLKTEGEACKMLRNIKRRYDDMLSQREQDIAGLRAAAAAEQDRDAEPGGPGRVGATQGSDSQESARG